MRVLLVAISLVGVLACKEDPQKVSKTINAYQGDTSKKLVSSTKESNSFPGDTTRPIEGKWVTFKAKHFFASYPASIYTGKLAMPDFSSVSYGNDTSFKKYILSGIKDEGINFAGRYTVITVSLGAMHSGIYVIDRVSGKIHDDFPFNDGGRWGYKFQPNSRMLIANAELLQNDTVSKYSDIWGMKPEIYFWNGRNLKRLQ